MPKNKTYDEVKQTYLNAAETPEVMKKLSPAHIVAMKKVEIEERKLQIAADALRQAIMSRLVGGRDIVDGEVVEDGTGRIESPKS